MGQDEINECLRKHGEMSILQLQEEIGISYSAIAYVLSRMFNSGDLYRRHDGRKSFYSLKNGGM